MARPVQRMIFGFLIDHGEFDQHASAGRRMAVIDIDDAKDGQMLVLTPISAAARERAEAMPEGHGRFVASRERWGYIKRPQVRDVEDERFGEGMWQLMMFLGGRYNIV